MDTHGLHPRRMLLLACGVFLAAGMVLSGLGPALPFLAARSQQHVVALGVLFTAISLGVILAQALVGRASDRFGLQIVLAAGMVLMSVGALALAVSSRFVLLVLAALLMGIGYGAVLSAGNLLVARLYPTRSAAALNGVNVFYGIGSIIGPLLAGYAGAQLGA
ncbi:MAG TPA: MFS transporter, partial [Kouleothrix sp.]|nr:MFS transporter [Kouleothrix sp.]